MAVDKKADCVVIGTSLAALEYAENNDCLILFNAEPAHFSYKKLLNGDYEYDRWQDCASRLAFDGKNPFGDKISQLRIKEEHIQIICHNRKYNVFYDSIAFFDDEKLEAAYIANTVNNLIQNGYKYQDISILSRTNKYTSALELLFIKHTIPHIFN